MNTFSDALSKSHSEIWSNLSQLVSTFCTVFTRIIIVVTIGKINIPLYYSGDGSECVVRLKTFPNFKTFVVVFKRSMTRTPLTER